MDIVLHLRKALTEAHPKQEELLEPVQDLRDLKVRLLPHPPFQVPALSGRFLVEDLLLAEGPDL